jgi:hypothetical protein
MIPRRVLALSLVLLAAPVPQALGAPKLVSLSPLGGQRGTSVEVEVRGSGLAGAYAVWLGAGTTQGPPKVQPDLPCTWCPGGLSAQVRAVPDAGRVKVRLVIAADARVGLHSLALVTPGGLSGSLAFWVGPHAVVVETGAPHNSAATAQSVQLPVAVHGRLTASGQLDYYAFDVPRAQTVAFEVVAAHGTGFDPQLALYESGGSFLDPQRSKRLVFREEITQGSMPANRRLTYHFTKPGRYVVNVGQLFAQGGDFTYLLRIAAADQATEPGSALVWGRQRLQEIRARTVGAPTLEIESATRAAGSFKMPAVLEGTIGHAGDQDHYRFRARADDKIAFEIHTPRAAAPHFNPRLDVLDAKGAVVLSNLQVHDGKIVDNTFKMIQVASRLAGRLEHDGEYTLRVRDLTSLQGSPDHVYWILARPQVPHVGAVHIQPDAPVHLAPGGRQRLTVKTALQEGFTGSVALSVDGLPPGVRAFVSASGLNIELVAEPSAPLTRLPHVLRLRGLAQAGDNSGSAFLVSEIPLMVLKK